MLAQRLNSILPQMCEEEAMSLAGIRSICQQRLDPETWLKRPFQSPHLDDVVKLFDTPQLSGILHFQTLFFIIVRADITQRRVRADITQRRM